MSSQLPSSKDDKSPFQRATSRAIDSKAIQLLANFPPIAWITKQVVRIAFKNKSGGATSAIDLSTDRSGSTDLQETLNSIVYDVVTAHGYKGAMLATYEQGDMLPVRAFFIDPAIATPEEIQKIEAEVSKFTPHPVSISDPTIARVYRHKEEHKENLSVKAVETGHPVTSDHLYDLLRPIAPPAAEALIQGFQEAIGIKEVIAVPFFLKTKVNGKVTQEIVGNLFAAKQSSITQQDILALSAFGRQASAAIESERRGVQSKIAQDLVYAMQTNLQSEEQILQHIAEGVVQDLGYVGAMVGTFEADESIPVRAFYVNPTIATMEEIIILEEEVSKFTSTPIKISDPSIARVYTNDPLHQKNLGSRAVKAGQPETSSDLFDLFRPIVPLAAEQTVKSIQNSLEISQVIAIPFFLETLKDGKLVREVIGNLFVATKSRAFSQGEIEILQAFGTQAAAGIRNARLYKKAEDRRKVAESFGRMAFSATANLEELRAHVSEFKNYLQVLQRLIGQHQFQENNIDLIKNMLDNNPEIWERLEDTSALLDNLHQPWQIIPDKPTPINTCIKTALENALSKKDTPYIDVKTYLAENLSDVLTSSEMLIEVFSVIIQNAVEAIEIRGREKDRNLWIRSNKQGKSIKIQIEDNGIGIKPENLNSIFEFEWSTKQQGEMGFGLYWAKDFIEGIGGEIQVESNWGSGTKFTITLPT